MTQGNGDGTLDGIRDFTPEVAAPIRFRVWDDVYEAARELPAGTLMDFIALADRFRGSGTETDGGQAVGLFTELFDLVLLPASAELFRLRLRDLQKPVPTSKLPEIVTWLFEEYSGRPLEQPPPSPDGPGPDGTSSTAAAPSPASTPAVSAPTAS